MKKGRDLSFIDKIIKLDYSEETFFINYYRLTDCLRKLEFDYSNTNCLALLNNNPKVLKLIKHIIDKNKDDVLSGNFTNFTKDIILINLIKAYCDSSKIEIRKKKINIKHIDNPILTLKEEALLFKLYQIGNKDAEDIIILRNLNLVRHFVYKFADKYEILDEHTINDLISYGTIGLYDALKDYDINKGKFTTYAAIKIISQITTYIKYNNYVISKSKSIVDRKNYLNNKENELTIILGRKPTKEEFSNYVDKPQNYIEKLTKKELTMVDIYIKNDTEEYCIFETIESDEKVDLELTEDGIMDLFDKCQLTDTQRRYLMHYCFEKMTFREIGQMYKITWQAVQNTIRCAAKKIQKSKYGQDYLAAKYENNLDKHNIRERKIN